VRASNTHEYQIFGKGGEVLTTEKSCGAIVYRKFHGNTEILLIRHVKSGYWSFPKGHIEDGETELETAVREIKEETGLDVFVDTGFRETVTFSPRRDAQKTVVYFVAKAARGHDISPQAGEISEIRWVEINKALNHLTYDNDRIIVNRAKAFIALMK
jgi:8-oxo-dGTP pyrophosphatase MutT (NUDIX family)